MFVSQKKKLDNSMMEEILGEECERRKILTSQKWQKCAPFLPLSPSSPSPLTTKFLLEGGGEVIE